jgi:hypothetical protein
MAKKITITLSDAAEQYFNEVAASLDYGDGKVVNQSQVVNHCLEELALFEKTVDTSVTDWLKTNHPEIFEVEPDKGTQQYNEYTSTPKK